MLSWSIITSDTAWWSGVYAESVSGILCKSRFAYVVQLFTASPARVDQSKLIILVMLCVCVCVNVSFRQIITNKMHAKHSTFTVYETISNWFNWKLFLHQTFSFRLLRSRSSDSIFLRCPNFIVSVLSQVFHNDCIAVCLTKTWEDSKWKGRKRQRDRNEVEQKNRLTDKSWYIHKTDFFTK